MTLVGPARTVTTIMGRGPLSEGILSLLAEGGDSGEFRTLAADAAGAADPITDDDLQLSLFLLYAVAYGSLPWAGVEWEWDLGLIAARRELESAFEASVRARVELPDLPPPGREQVAEALFTLTAPQQGPSLSRYVARRATREQALELLVQRSVYTLREADAHSWTIPKLHGRAKAALVEIQADEYGGGDPDRVHQVLYAQALRAAGLDDTYGAYVDAVPAITLASFNLMTMFGMNRRLRGASVGHLAAFEMTSSIPCRLIAQGLRRLRFDEDVTAYYDEHVEADAVHEQIAGRDLAGALAEDEPELLGDIIFGAAACLFIDGMAGDHILHSWERGVSSLRHPISEIAESGARS